MSCHLASATLLLLAPAVALAQQSPVISSLNPSFRLSTDPPFTLTVLGGGFVPGSTVLWNVTPLPTVFVSTAQLTASVAANLFQTVIGSQNFDVYVVNPGGARSNVLRVQVVEPIRVTDVRPNSVLAGGPQFTLTVNGSGFETSMIVLWNATQLATNYISRTVLTAVVPAALIATPGTAQISVFHPGHGTLPPITLTIQPPLPPSIATLSPSSASVGSASFTLTVTGAGFLAGAAVRWNATPLATNFISATQLTAVVPASLTSNPGGAVITVANPNGSVSNAVSFSVTCEYAISAVGSSSPGATSAVVAAGGGNGAVRVTTGPGCAWIATSTAAWLAISAPSSGSGSGAISYTVAANVGPSRSAALAVAGQTFTVLQLGTSRTPSISQFNGVVNAASLEPAIASSAWVSVFGANLSATERTWAGPDLAGGKLPTALDGVGVKINGRPAYVYYISPNQLNVLAPEDGAEGPVSVEVSTPEGTSAVVLVSKQRIAPALFTFPAPAAGYAAAVFPDGALVLKPSLLEGASSRTAKPGDHIALYATGLGQTNPPYEDGQVVRQPASLTSDIVVELGSVPAAVEFAGIIGPGLYQINIQVPDLPDGDAPLIVRLGAAASQAQVVIPVQR